MKPLKLRALWFRFKWWLYLSKKWPHRNSDGTLKINGGGRG